VVGEHNIMNVI